MKCIEVIQLFIIYSYYHCHHSLNPLKSMKEVLVLVGLPGSGKSTLAARLQKLGPGHPEL